MARVVYDPSIHGFLPTIGKSPAIKGHKMRELISIASGMETFMPRNLNEDEILLVTHPALHIRTVFGRESVGSNTFAQGYLHTSASVPSSRIHLLLEISMNYMGKSKRELAISPRILYPRTLSRICLFFRLLSVARLV